MSYFQYYDIDINAGDCVVGIITDIDYSRLEADVEGIGSNIPIHYHCDNETIEDSGKPFDLEYPNEDDERGASAFAVGDNVIVMYRRFDGLSPVIIGFVDGPRACAFSFKITGRENSVLGSQSGISFHVFDENRMDVEITPPSFNQETGDWSFSISDISGKTSGPFWVKYICTTYFDTQYHGRGDSDDWWNEADLIPVGSYIDSMESAVFTLKLIAGGEDGGFLITPDNIYGEIDLYNVPSETGDPIPIPSVIRSYDEETGIWTVSLFDKKYISISGYWVKYNYDKGLVGGTMYPGRYLPQDDGSDENEQFRYQDKIKEGYYEDIVRCGFFSFDYHNRLTGEYLETDGGRAFYWVDGSSSQGVRIEDDSHLIISMNQTGTNVAASKEYDLFDEWKYEEEESGGVWLRGSPDHVLFPNNIYAEYPDKTVKDVADAGRWCIGTKIIPQNNPRKFDSHYWEESYERIYSHPIAGFWDIDGIGYPICNGEKTYPFGPEQRSIDSEIPGANTETGWWGIEADGWDWRDGSDHEPNWAFVSFYYYWPTYYGGDGGYHDEPDPNHENPNWNVPSYATYYWKGQGWTDGGSWSSSLNQPAEGQTVYAQMDVLNDWEDYLVKNRTFQWWYGEWYNFHLTLSLLGATYSTKRWTIKSSLPYQRRSSLSHYEIPLGYSNGTLMTYWEYQYYLCSAPGWYAFDEGYYMAANCRVYGPSIDLVHLSGEGISYTAKSGVKIPSQDNVAIYGSTGGEGTIHSVTATCVAPSSVVVDSHVNDLHFVIYSTENEIRCQFLWNY